MQVIEAHFEHLSLVSDIFRDYARSLDFDLSFQNFEQELANLPGDYAEPDGCILLAIDGAQVAGCVALRKCAEGVGEMKRLYVKPDYQGQKLGRKLAMEIIQRAKAKKYLSLRLDTVASMQAAQNLYLSLGFRAISPYRENPIPGASYFELKL